VADGNERLRALMNAVTERVLQHTLSHGTFGMQTLDGLHDQIPASTCDCCGACCFSISFYSLEYHRIIRWLAENRPPADMRVVLFRALRPDDRLVLVGDEERYRCVFLDETSNRCTIHPVRPFMCRVFGQLFDGVRECERVRSDEPLSSTTLEALATRVAGCSEQIRVPTDDGTVDVVDFFPLEFWVMLAVDGVDRALAWYRRSPFYRKWLTHRSWVTGLGR